MKWERISRGISEKIQRVDLGYRKCYNRPRQFVPGFGKTIHIRPGNITPEQVDALVNPAIASPAISTGVYRIPLSSQQQPYTRKSSDI